MSPSEEQALADALKHAQVQDWSACLSACRELADSDDLILAAVARLNVMICHYQQGLYAQVLSADLVHLLDHLPSTGRPTCLCVAILAAHQLNEFKMSKFFMLILARWEMEPLDLPSTPQFVMLNGETQTCRIVESADSTPMIEIVEELITETPEGDDEQQALASLLERYQARAATMAALPQRRH